MLSGTVSLSLSPAHITTESLQSFLVLRLLSSLSWVMIEKNIIEVKATFYPCKITKVTYFLIFKLPNVRLKDL